MRVQVVAVGNSRGIRLPKAILKECEIDDAVNLAVEQGKVVLTPIRATPRIGWEQAALRMRTAADDGLLIPDVFPDDADLDW
jgi:antitoxin MazE